MELIDRSDLDHVSYILILYSLASLLFLFANMLIGLWDRLANPRLNTKKFTNGNNIPNGRAMEDGRLRDAEEFELDGLMSDDDDDDDDPSRMMLRLSEDGQPKDHGQQQ